MFFGGMSFDPFSMFQQESDVWSSLAEGAVKGILSFFVSGKRSKSNAAEISPQGMQVLQQILAETQMSGPQLPEVVIQKALAFGLPQEEAQLIAASYAFQMLRFSTIGMVVQQAFFQEVMTGFPAEQTVSNISMQKGLPPHEIQMATQMVTMAKARRPFIRQALHQILSWSQNQPLTPMQVYQQALQLGLMPVEAFFVAGVMEMLL